MGWIRRIEVIEAANNHLKNIIKACIEVNFKLNLLRAEISKIQSRRAILEKTQYENKVWFEYHELSNTQYYDVLMEYFREIEITESFLRFLLSLGTVKKISDVETVINTLEFFCRYNGIDEP